MACPTLIGVHIQLALQSPLIKTIFAMAAIFPTATNFPSAIVNFHTGNRSDLSNAKLPSSAIFVLSNSPSIIGSLLDESMTEEFFFAAPIFFDQHPLLNWFVHYSNNPCFYR